MYEFTDAMQDMQTGTYRLYSILKECEEGEV